MTDTATQVTKKRANKAEQLLLETAIIKYQAAIKQNNSRVINRTYNDICNIYPVMTFVSTWMKRYIYLYDSQEDFTQDYLRIFCTSLLSWKPRLLRKASKYNGSGDFKNYFWSSLQNNYINMVKAENAGKRSISTKCPICDEWCMSLSTHLIKQHGEFLWRLMLRSGFSVEKIDKCPFCQSCNIPASLIKIKDYKTIEAKLKRHIMSMHSSYLFDYFKEEYPGQIISPSSKLLSIHVQEQDGEGDFNLYDTVSADSKMDDLYAFGLSEIQKQIVYKIFNDRKTKLTAQYDVKLYNCTEQEFQDELECLKEKLFMCGIGEDKK